MVPPPGRPGAKQTSAADRWKRVSLATNVVTTLAKPGDSKDAKETADSSKAAKAEPRPYIPPTNDPNFQLLSKNFYERVKTGNRGTRLEGELRSYIKDIQSALRLDDVSKDETRDRTLVQNVRRACEATVEKCFLERAKEQVDLDRAKTEYEQLQNDNRKMQKKRVIENIGSRDKIRKPDPNDSHMTSEEAEECPELKNLDADSRELCEIAVNERVRQILERPNKVLLDAINKFLETEDMPESWTAKVVPEAPEKDKGSPRSLAALLRPPRPLVKTNTADKAKIAELQKQIQQVEAELAKLRMETKGINEEKEMYSRELEAARLSSTEELQELRDQLKLARGELHDKILWLQKQVAKEKSPEADRELEKLKKEVHKLQKEMDKSKEADLKYRAEGEKLLKKIPEMEEKVQKARAWAAKRREDIQELIDERDQLRKQIEELNQSIAEVENMLKEMNQMQKDGLRFDENGNVYSIKKPRYGGQRKISKGSRLPTIESDVTGEASAAELQRREAERLRELERERRRQAQRKLMNRLILVLESQNRLASPDGKPKVYESPLSQNARLAPTGDKKNSIIQLLSEAETEGILDVSDDESKSPGHILLNAKKNAPSVMKGRMKHADQRQRLGPATTMQSMYVLAPDDYDPLQEKMRPSQSCADFGVSKRKEAMGLTC